MTSKQLTITITDADIANGSRCDYVGCPVYLAIERQLGTDDIVVGGMGRTQIGKKYYLHSEEVSKFIDDFDRYEPVRPGEYTLTLDQD